MFHSSNKNSKKDIQILNLSKVQEFIDMGRFVPKPNELTTMRDLLAAGLVSQVREGVKLLGKVIRKYDDVLFFFVYILFLYTLSDLNIVLLRLFLRFLKK